MHLSHLRLPNTFLHDLHLLLHFLHVAALLDLVVIGEAKLRQLDLQLDLLLLVFQFLFALYKFLIQSLRDAL